MRQTMIALGIAAAMGTAVAAQIDYDGIRRTWDTFIRVFKLDPADIPTWFPHQEEDSFTRETRLYARGWGADGVLFMVAACDQVAIALGDDLRVFESGTIETIWDDGPIEVVEAQDLNRSLVISDAEWVQRLRTHDELRMRVRLFQNVVASDSFDLTSARLSTNMTASGEVEDVAHVRDIFDAIGCE